VIQEHEMILGTHRRITAALATLTIIAMLLTPFCGALCGTVPGCVFSPTSPESQVASCHHEGTASDDSGSQFVATKSCSPADLPVATLNPFKDGSELQPARNVASAQGTLAALEQFTTFPNATCALSPSSGGLPTTHDLFVDTVVLRI
jgi:hypothetical protein